MRIPRTLLVAAVVVLTVAFARVTTSAADGTISGVVTDDAGKPIRGAIVKATAGNNSVARFTDDNGKYELTGLKGGEQQVLAFATGYGQQTLKRGTADSGPLNFSLRSRFDVTRLSTSELLTTLPENRETRFIRAACSGCHTLYPIAQKRGLQAKEWEDLLQRMGVTTGLGIRMSPTRLAYAGEVLEKYFGPDAEFDQANLKSAPIAPAVLNATYYEYKTPTFTKLIHSIVADNKGNGWFTEYDWQSNKMARLNFETGEISEWPIQTQNSAPHTPIVDKDGLVWTPLADGNALLLFDPKTLKMTEYPVPVKEWGMGPDQPARLHTPAIDAEGNVWLSSTLTKYIYKFNRKTEKFERYPAAEPKAASPETQTAWASAPGENRGPGMGASYHVELDSKGKIWYTQLGEGTVVSMDPKTKETKVYKAPGVISSRGMAIDAQDNVWYSNWDGHTIVRLDQKTGEFKQYQPPTQYAAPYGMVFDKKGNLWYADYMGNNITMFDPKTEQFLEYPMPTQNSMPRFISVDDHGRVWFTEWWHSKVGVLVPNGTAAPAPQQTARR